MDFILGILVTPWLIWSVLILCLLSDFGIRRSDDYSGWAAVWFIALIVLGIAHYAASDIVITWQLALTGIIGYLAIGGLWSLWRYRSFIIEAINETKAEYANSDKLRDRLIRLKHETRASNYVGFIVFHMMAFPISFVTHVFGDVYRAMATFVRRYMVGIFNTVHRKLFKDIE